ncbi:unnamed protein product [Closterium sp. NIES-65]|nr:unnamed protein product [Closterium sp. NIES-65]
MPLFSAHSLSPPLLSSTPLPLPPPLFPPLFSNQEPKVRVPPAPLLFSPILNASLPTTFLHLIPRRYRRFLPALDSAHPLVLSVPGDAAPKHAVCLRVSLLSYSQPAQPRTGLDHRFLPGLESTQTRVLSAPGDAAPKHAVCLRVSLEEPDRTCFAVVVCCPALTAASSPGLESTQTRVLSAPGDAAPKHAVCLRGRVLPSPSVAARKHAVCLWVAEESEPAVELSLSEAISSPVTALHLSGTTVFASTPSTTTITSTSSSTENDDITHKGADAGLGALLGFDDPFAVFHLAARLAAWRSCSLLAPRLPTGGDAAFPPFALNRALPFSPSPLLTLQPLPPAYPSAPPPCLPFSPSPLLTLQPLPPAYPSAPPPCLPFSPSPLLTLQPLPPAYPSAPPPCLPFSPSPLLTLQPLPPAYPSAPPPCLPFSPSPLLTLQPLPPAYPSAPPPCLPFSPSPLLTLQPLPPAYPSAPPPCLPFSPSPLLTLQPLPPAYPSAPPPCLPFSPSPLLTLQPLPPAYPSAPPPCLPFSPSPLLTLQPLPPAYPSAPPPCLPFSPSPLLTLQPLPPAYPSAPPPCLPFSPSPLLTLQPLPPAPIPLSLPPLPPLQAAPRLPKGYNLQPPVRSSLTILMSNPLSCSLFLFPPPLPLSPTSPPPPLPTSHLQPPIRSSLTILIAGSDAAWRQHMPPPLHPANLTAALHKECSRAHLPCEVVQAQEGDDPCTDQVPAWMQADLLLLPWVPAAPTNTTTVNKTQARKLRERQREELERHYTPELLHLGFQGVLKWIREQLKGWEGKGGSKVERKGVRGEVIEDDEYACAGREVENVGAQHEEEDDLWDSDENPGSDKKT